MGLELQFRNGLEPFGLALIANDKAVDALLKLGFVRDAAKERLFIPVKVNADLLAKGFEENDLDKALAPVGKAIELAIAAKPDLDKIVEQVREAAMGELIAAGRRVFDELKNVCVWNKKNAGMGTFYRSKHEMVFVFKKGRVAHVNTFGLGDGGSMHMT